MLSSVVSGRQDQENCPCSAVHLPLTHVPTSPIVAMTAMSRMPSSTVYSIKDAPSSSLPSRRTTFQAFDMNSPICLHHCLHHDGAISLSAERWSLYLTIYA